MGGVAALWLHGLAEDPSRTNVVVSFMGWGALASTVAVLGRIMNTARKLRDRREALAFSLTHPPGDPTEGLLGKAWWQVPSVFAFAGGVACGYSAWPAPATYMSRGLEFRQRGSQLAASHGASVQFNK